MFLVACEFFFYYHGLKLDSLFCICAIRTICTIRSELLVLSGSCLLEHGQTGHTLHNAVDAITHTSRNETYQWRRYANASGVLSG